LSLPASRDKEFQPFGRFAAGPNGARIALSPDEVGLVDVLWFDHRFAGRHFAGEYQYPVSDFEHTERMEEALGEEQVMFAHGCPRDWADLPMPDGRITVGLDGGFVHAREGDNRKAGWFEVIAGKSVTWEGEAKCFSFVHSYDEKPKRRLGRAEKWKWLQKP
jgi:hypothetical protein